jgi:hypothetical protein
VLELQRAAGNQATAAALGTQTADVPPKPPAGNAGGSPAVKERRVGASKIVNAATTVAPVLGRLSAGAAAALHPVLALQRAAGGGATVAPPAEKPKGPAEKLKTGAPKRLAGSKDETAEDKAVRLAAAKIIDDAAKAEPNVTSVLSAVAAANFGALEGLENRLKTDVSLARKLGDLVKTRVDGGEPPDKALSEEVANIKDALRYTVIVNSSRYASVANTTIPAALAGVGAVQIKNKNTWIGKDKSDSYHGINQVYTVELKPGTRFPFEVQIHTSESWDMKTKQHAEYEEARKADTTPERRKELEDKMAKGWETVPVPKGMV